MFAQIQRIGMALLLCAFAPESVAGVLQGETSGVWEAATALCLALISAAKGDWK